MSPIYAVLLKTEKDLRHRKELWDTEKTFIAI